MAKTDSKPRGFPASRYFSTWDRHFEPGARFSEFLFWAPSRRACLPSLLPLRPSGQEVIDRIAARVESDIILLSDIRALARYQQLVEGKAENDAQILDRLIDQWIVRNEADTAQFPHPSDADVAAGVERVQKSFTSAVEFETRKEQIGLTTRKSKRWSRRPAVSRQLSGLEISSFGQSGAQGCARVL